MLKLFNKGFELYEEGKWTEAAKQFRNMLKIRPKDGPTIAILGYIEKNNFAAPFQWEGCREITDYNEE
jgi:hypothetical protein